MSTTFLHGDCRTALHNLPAGHFHCCATSPPYFGLRDYGGGDAEIGREALHDCLGWATGSPCGECYVCHIVDVGRGVRHALRADGTFWLNLGDSYVSTATGSQGANSKLNGGKKTQEEGGKRLSKVGLPGLKPKDLSMIPARVALALQADGWYLRDNIAWVKGNAMPGSQDDRCTTAHESIFMFTKRPRYFYDRAAIMEPIADASRGRAERKLSLMDRTGVGTLGKQIQNGVDGSHAYTGLALGRNGKTGYRADGMRTRRNVWSVSTSPFAGEHFACWPPALVRLMILAGTSAAGVCPHCSAPWMRVTEAPFTAHTGDTESAYQTGSSSNRLARLRQAAREQGAEYSRNVETVGWKPTCGCRSDLALDSHQHDPVPARVLDPFGGSGTTAAVATELGRDATLIELNPAYLDDIARVRVGNAQPPLALTF